MAIKKIRIFDMDGTIVCSLHRYKTVTFSCGTEKIDLQHWRDNEYRAMEDSLLPLAEYYKQCLADDECFTVIATARVLNSPDRQFIREILGQPNHIISRAHDDTRSGGLLKVLGLRRLWGMKQLQTAIELGNVRFYEDNMSYLKTVCDEFNIQGVYVPSKQGH